MRPLKLALAATATVLALAACNRDTKAPPPANDLAVNPIETEIAVLQGGDWRDAANVARDKYRHPAQTLAFFGIRPDTLLGTLGLENGVPTCANRAGTWR